jgi:hypothetical protein
VFIPFVLIFSLTFKIFDLGGAEWLIQIVLLSGITWLYHTSSYCQVGNLSIKHKKNMFGHSLLYVKNLETGGKERHWFRSREIRYINKDTNVSVDIWFFKDRTNNVYFKVLKI